MLLMVLRIFNTCFLVFVLCLWSGQSSTWFFLRFLIYELSRFYF